MPYYNTASPTPSTKNTITNIVMDYGIRDFLLNKNLGVGTGGFYPQYSTAINGSPKIGEPVLDTMIGMGNVVVPSGLPLEVEGIVNWAKNILPNQFKDQSGIAGTLLTIDDVQIVPKFSATWPLGIQDYPKTATDQVYQYGIMGKTIEKEYRKKSTLKNLYLDADAQVDGADWVSLETLPFDQQIKGYLDTYGGLNLGGSAGIQAANIIGSALNGQGLGLAKGGIVTNFDIRSSLAGRVLGATGLINDTKLGMIGGQQLVLALANNAIFNTEQALLGSLNVQDNVLSLVKGDGLAGFRPNYQITVPKGKLGKFADYTGKLLGFTIPRSYLDDDGSIFSDENGYAENIARANSMILNTGKGQVVALLKNITANNAVNSIDKKTNPFRVGYAPGFTDNKGVKQITDGILYAFGNSEGNLIDPLKMSDSRIPDMSIDREARVEESGFSGIPDVYYEANGPFKPNAFTWLAASTTGAVNTDERFDPPPLEEKSLLSKTQKLFNSKGMKNIVGAKGDMTINTPTQLMSAVVGNGISHGNAVLREGAFDQQGNVANSIKTADETYCRSWTTLYRYDSVRKQVRFGSDWSDVSTNGLYTTIEGDGNLDAVGVPYRFQTQGTVLDKYGNPQIAPYITDATKTDPKKYMLSIENLAWFDNVQNLLGCEVGPGDLISGKKGRIMWFPPYNIQFNESTNVTWDSNLFIGRGEPVYTYSNAERSGTLSFSIIVDHPSYVNSFSASKNGGNSPDDSYVASFFAGCVPPTKFFSDKLTVSEISELVKSTPIQPAPVEAPPQLAPDNFYFYFPNDYALVDGTIGIGYESGLSGATPTDKIDYNIYFSGYGIGEFVGGVTSKTSWNDTRNYGLNGWRNPVEVDKVSFSGISDPAYMPALAAYLENKCPACRVQVTSFASPQGNATSNKKLADSRSENMIKYLKTFLYIGKDEEYIKARFKPMPNKPLTEGESSCKAKAKSLTDTYECKVDRRTFVEFIYDPALLPKAITTAPPTETKEEVRTVKSTIRNRFYTECNYFEQLTDADYFVFDKFRDKIKYFHPAFHSTTPEGLNSRLTFLNQCTRQGPTLESQGANNLAFGRPPVCILRIGDFYNTKIIIDNLGIDYEPIVWDLNPEGIGVQPMIANVTLSFKFVGGSTLMGPINKLQNALSFNYYANTQVYDPRADYVAKNRPKEAKGETKSGYYINNGITNMNPETKAPTPEEVKNETPSVDQPAAALEKAPVAPVVADTRSNDEKIFQTRKDGAGYVHAGFRWKNDKLVGNFGLFEGLSKDTEVKASLFSPLGNTYIDLATFKIMSVDGKGNWESNMSKNDLTEGGGTEIKNSSGNTIALSYGVKFWIPSMPSSCNVFNLGFIVSRKQCASEDIEFGEIIGDGDLSILKEKWPCTT
jgi:phage FluMu protein Com